MSKFAANLTMLFNELPFLDRFDAAQAVGFRAVECLFPYEWPAVKLQQCLIKNKLTQALFNMPPGDWAGGERGLAAIPEREEEFRSYLPMVREYAQALDCKKVHAMCGIINPHHTLENHHKTLVNNIRYAADFLAKDGIAVLLEPLNHRDMPRYFLTHQFDALKIIQEIDRPNVAVQLDLYHAQIMDGDLSHLIVTLGSAIGHVQIASVPDRHEPDEGEINYSYVLGILEKVGYQGWIGCEYKPRGGTVEGLKWFMNQENFT